MQRNHVSPLERGLNAASIKTLFKLSPVLSVSVSAMLRLVEQRVAPPP
ncbi:MAG: hypothetical protein QM661_12170 [Solimonas sp.]